MINTSLCYPEQDGKYLMMHRIKKKNDVNHDKWIGLGGKFEDGESPEECVCREVLEESGLVLHHPEYRGIVTFVCPPYPTEWMHLFTCRDFSGEIGECNEGCLEWVEKEKIRDLPIWEGDKIFFDLLDQNVPFFSLKLVYEDGNLKDAYLNGEKIQ